MTSFAFPTIPLHHPQPPCNTVPAYPSSRLTVASANTTYTHQKQTQTQTQTQTQLGAIELSPPLILAPMAGVTTPPFRALCASYGATLTIAEMLHASLYLSDDMSTPPSFNSTETRSAQLYGTEPDDLAAAAARLVHEHGVCHIDLNLGCPAPKVIKRGGGAALPADEHRLTRIARCMRAAVPQVALTAKLRLGAKGQETFLQAGEILAAEGFDGVTLHARLAEDRYIRGVGRANWSRIGELVDRVGTDMRVFGNGDVFRASDATCMMRESGAHGVVIGRGALGRPWLFHDLSRALQGETMDVVTMPSFDIVRATWLRHVADEVQWRAKWHVNETQTIRTMRKWVAWYFQGYCVPEDWTRRICRAETMIELHEIVAEIDDGVDVAIDEKMITAERGKVGVQ